MSLKQQERQMSLIVPHMAELVSATHAYRRLVKVVDWSQLTKPLEQLYSDLGRGGYPVAQGFRCLLLQFLDDLSDRELERYLQENLAGKYFCGFEPTDQTPDFSYFSRLRSRIGTKRLAALFNRVQYTGSQDLSPKLFPSLSQPLNATKKVILQHALTVSYTFSCPFAPIVTALSAAKTTASLFITATSAVIMLSF
jgi:transposase